MHHCGTRRECAHLKAVSQEIGVRCAPGERPELHDRDEASQVVHLPLQVLAVPQPAQVEQLCACIGSRTGSNNIITGANLPGTETPITI